MVRLKWSRRYYEYFVLSLGKVINLYQFSYVGCSTYNTSSYLEKSRIDRANFEFQFLRGIRHELRSQRKDLGWPNTSRMVKNICITILGERKRNIFLLARSLVQSWIPSRNNDDNLSAINFGSYASQNDKRDKNALEGMPNSQNKIADSRDLLWD